MPKQQADLTAGPSLVSSSQPLSCTEIVSLRVWHAERRSRYQKPQGVRSVISCLLTVAVCATVCAQQSAVVQSSAVVGLSCTCVLFISTWRQAHEVLYLSASSLPGPTHAAVLLQQQLIFLFVADAPAVYRLQRTCSNVQLLMRDRMIAKAYGTQCLHLCLLSLASCMQAAGSQNRSL